MPRIIHVKFLYSFVEEMNDLIERLTYLLIQEMIQKWIKKILYPVKR